MTVMYKHDVISRYIFTIHHLKSIRLYFILTILITEDGSEPYFDPLSLNDIPDTCIGNINRYEHNLCKITYMNTSALPNK